MGIFEASESRSELRTIYMPAGPNGMAHRSSLSPDHRNVLVVEMDLGSWQPCRLVPFRGGSMGTRVGPQPAQCTDAAWSPDGSKLYYSESGSIYSATPDGSDPHKLLTVKGDPYRMRFSPDGFTHKDGSPF